MHFVAEASSRRRADTIRLCLSRRAESRMNADQLQPTHSRGFAVLWSTCDCERPGLSVPATGRLLTSDIVQVVLVHEHEVLHRVACVAEVADPHFVAGLLAPVNILRW